MNDKQKKSKQGEWLRWLLVLPVACAAGIGVIVWFTALGSLLLAFYGMLTDKFHLLSGAVASFMIVIGLTFWIIATCAASPIFFIWAGTITAPKHHSIVKIGLILFYIAALIFLTLTRILPRSIWEMLDYLVFNE